MWSDLVKIERMTILNYGALFRPSHFTVQLPSFGKPGAHPLEPSHPAAIIAMAYKRPTFRSQRHFIIIGHQHAPNPGGSLRVRIEARDERYQHQGKTKKADRKSTRLNSRHLGTSYA